MGGRRKVGTVNGFPAAGAVASRSVDLELLEPRLLLEAAPLPGQLWPVDQTAWRVVGGDFNGDHLQDIAIAEMPTSGLNDPGTVSVQLNQGNGVFGTLINTPCGTMNTFSYPLLVAADFNGDGLTDLATQKYSSNYELHCSIFLSKGDGMFQSPTDYVISVGAGVPGGGYSAPCAADFNNDGKTDLAFNDHVYVNGGYKTFVKLLLGRGDGAFDQSPAYDVLDEAIRNLTPGDFDGDKNTDLAIYGDYDARVSVLWGKGDGTFAAHQEYAIDSGAGFLQAADFNNDGVTDLATVHGGTGLIAIYLGSKARGFPTHLHVSTDASPSSFSTGDPNGDGNVDMMVFHPHGYDPTGHVAVYLGNGDGTFQAGASYDAPDSLQYYSGLVTDLNGDGFTDLGFLVRFYAFSFLQGAGDGTFHPGSCSTWGISAQPGVVCGDFNGDGAPDLATAGTKNATHRVSVLLNNADGTFAAANFPLSVAPGNVAAVDLNGNGALDLVVGGSGAATSISVLTGNGDGTFGSAVTYTAGSGAALIATGDFNGDGHADVAVGNTGERTVSILLGSASGDGTLGAQTRYTLSASDSLATPRSIIAVDVNEDRKTDLVVGTQRGLYLLLGNGNGTFQAATALQRANIAKEDDGIASADLNADGHADLVVAERNSQSVWVLLGSGAGTFPTCQRYTLSTAALTVSLYSVCLGDFDIDGDQDVAVLTDQGIFGILHNNGSGTLSQPTSYAAGSTAGQILAADLNADGTPDVVTCDSAIPAVMVYLSHSPFLSEIDSPIHSGSILQDDSLRFAGSWRVPSGIPSLAWNLGDGRTSTQADAGLVTFHLAGVKQISFAANDSHGPLDPSPATTTITVAPDTGPQPDLAVTAVRMPADLAVGQAATIEYTVVNRGDAAVASTSWTDSVYLSSDPYLDRGDKLLGSASASRALAVGAAYSGSVEVTIQGTSVKAPYLIVSVDDQWQVLEQHQLNNEYAAQTELQVPVLTDGVPLAGRFLDTGAANLYQITIPAGTNLRVRLEDADGLGVNDLYARFGQPPTRDDYQARSSGAASANAEILLPAAAEGTWYFLAYGASVPGKGAYTITAQTGAVFVSDVHPQRLGNLVDTTLTVEGAGFVPGARVALVAENSTVYWLSHVQVDSLTRLRATVLAGTVPAGTYTVRVSLQSGPSSDLPAAVQVLSGAAISRQGLRLRFFGPGQVGYHHSATFYLQYTNASDLPMPAPVVGITAFQSGRDAAILTLDSSLVRDGLYSMVLPAGTGNAAALVASGQTTGILMPGESMLVPVYYSGWQMPYDMSYPPIEFFLGSVTSDSSSPINWADLKDRWRPRTISADAWEPIWNNFVSQTGSTAGEYLDMLTQNAVYLAGLGVDAGNMDALLSFAMAQGDGLSLPGSQDSVVDLSLSAPGLPLVLERSFYSQISRRYALGPLGRGWSTNWDIFASAASDGSVRITDPGGSVRVFNPDQRGGYLGEPQDAGTLSSRSGGGYILREASGQITAFRADGKLDYFEDANGNRITAGYSGKLVTSLKHSDGQSVLIAYNAGGRIQTITDPSKRQIRFTYDAANEHLLSVQYPDGRTIRYTYVSGQGAACEHALASVEYPDGSHLYFTYTPQGRLAGRSRDGGAQAVTFQYDSVGIIGVTDALGNTTRYFLDNCGRVAEVQDALGNSVANSFDAAGNLVQQTDEAGRIFNYSYDSKGRLTLLQDPMYYETAFAYNSAGQLAKATDPKGNACLYGYDARGNPTSATQPDGSKALAQYDSKGDLIGWTNRRANGIVYTYDARGLIIRKQYPDTSHVDYAYDLHGNMVSATDASGTTQMLYDANDHLVRITYPGGAVLSFTYDSVGRRTSRTDQLGHVTHYQYDALSRLESIANEANSLIAQFSYDAAGQLIREDLGNGAHVTYQYDALGRLAVLANVATGNSDISRFEYSYDSLGRTTSLVTLDGTWTYAYDSANRLVHATFASSRPGVSNQDLVYEYDAAGNRTRTVTNGVETSYASNSMDQYTTVGGRTWQYDADGNLIGLGGTGPAATFTYDVENRLVGITQGSDTWTFAYDALGNRRSATHNGVTTRYVIDPVGWGNVVGEYDGSGNLIARYEYSLGSALVSRIDSSGASQYYAFDGTGNTQQLVGSGAAVLNSYSYGPFGEVLDRSETVPNPFTWTGSYGAMCDGDGLIAVRAREYDPRAGRFLSEDPARTPGDNPYTYARNLPTNLVDPTGSDALTFQMADWMAKRGMGGFTGGVPDSVLGTVANNYGYVNLGTTINIASKSFKALAAGVNLGHGLMTDNASEITRGLAMGGLVIGSALVGTTVGTVCGTILGLWTVGELVYNLPGYFRSAADALAGEWAYLTSGGGLRPIPKDVQRERFLLQLMKWNSQWLGGAVGSMDPNQKTGPSGYGSQGYVASGQWMAYSVEFENDPSATAPAQYVEVVDPLDPSLDWSTFQLTEVGFGDHFIAVPPDTRHFETSEPMTYNGASIDVHVTADIDLDTGQVRVIYSSLDPQTGLPPDVALGFLPQEDGSGRGQGFFGYLVRAKDDLADGTEIRNVARITFDFGETIATNQVAPHDPSQGTDPAKECLNTIDATPPTSSVAVVPAVSRKADVPIQWSGSDSGSGLAAYDVYVRDNGGTWTLWQDGSAEASAVFHGEDGHVYDFYSTAIDQVGLEEAAPASPDATVTLNVDHAPQIGSLEASPGTVLQGDPLILTAHGVTDSDGTVAKVEFYCDFDGDGTAEPVEKIGAGISQGGGDWTWSGPVTWGGGNQTYLAQATDDEGAQSLVASASGTVTIPGLDVLIGDGQAAKAVTFVDPDGTRVTVTIKGGWATLTLYGRSLVSTPGKSALTVTGPVTAAGQNIRIGKITLGNTTAKSALTIATKGGNGLADVDEIVGNLPVGSLTAKTVQLTGRGIAMTGAGSIATIALHDILNGADIVFSNTATVAKGVTLSAGWITDGSQIDLGGAGLKSLTLSQWDGGKLTAPWVGAITTKADLKRAAPLPGNFGADLRLSGVGATKTTLGTVKIAGDLKADLWDITGNLGNLTVGGAAEGESPDDPLAVRASGSMGALVLGAVIHADFLSGITASAPRHAAFFGDFVNPTAKIASISIKGFKADPGRRCLMDGNFSAPVITSATVLNLQTDNDGEQFGLFALDTGPGSGIKSVKGKDLTTKVTWAWPLKTALTSPSGDFVIRIV